MLNKETLYPYLHDLENRLDEEQEQALWQNWRRFADHSTQKGCLFVPISRTPRPSSLHWPEININDALEDDTLMMLKELKTVSDHLQSGSSAILQARPNYGVGILPSLFGAEPFIMPYEMNCLPNVRPLSGYLDSIQQILHAPVDISKGYSEKVFRFAENLSQIFLEFPKIAAFVYPEHPDCQGPMDVCELLWGSNLFVDLYDVPDLVHAFLEKICDTYLAFLSKWFEIFPPKGYHPWFGRLHKGTICIRNDSAMNLSPDFYREFILPYDSKLLNAFHGGAIHFCGRGDHFIQTLAETDHLFSVDVSQPHLNNMDTILSHTVDQNITLTCRKDAYLDRIDFSKHKYENLTVWDAV